MDIEFGDPGTAQATQVYPQLGLVRFKGTKGFKGVKFQKN